MSDSVKVLKEMKQIALIETDGAGHFIKETKERRRIVKKRNRALDEALLALEQRDCVSHYEPKKYCQTCIDFAFKEGKEKGRKKGVLEELARHNETIDKCLSLVIDDLEPVSLEEIMDSKDCFVCDVCDNETASCLNLCPDCNNREQGALDRTNKIISIINSMIDVKNDSLAEALVYEKIIKEIKELEGERFKSNKTMNSFEEEL